MTEEGRRRTPRQEAGQEHARRAVADVEDRTLNAVLDALLAIRPAVDALDQQVRTVVDELGQIGSRVHRGERLRALLAALVIVAVCSGFAALWTAVRNADRDSILCEAGNQRSVAIRALVDQSPGVTEEYRAFVRSQLPLANCPAGWP